MDDSAKSTSSKWTAWLSIPSEILAPCSKIANYSLKAVKRDSIKVAKGTIDMFFD
jgi:hypothetical protein